MSDSVLQGHCIILQTRATEHEQICGIHLLTKAHGYLNGKISPAGIENASLVLFSVYAAYVLTDSIDVRIFLKKKRKTNKVRVLKWNCLLLTISNI